ncbi:MAG: transposase [Nitrospirae bacterium]|nr:transposase [Nitrospirota bacterium]
MPRIPRGQVAGYAYHVINRGNGGAAIFHNAGDYQVFLRLLCAAKTRFAVKVFGFCLMPNHFHLVLQPETAMILSAFMQWWLTSHVRRFHRHHGSSGHVWQGRFKSFPIQQDGHFLTVLRYVLCNPVRAGMVERVNQWPWSSHSDQTIIDPWPVPCPSNWNQWLNVPLIDHALDRLRIAVNRQQPFGSPNWQTHTAKRLGLESRLRDRGRPRKIPEK